MDPVFYDKNDTILNEGDKADALYILFDGIIEIYTVMDNQSEFIIERLTKGSIINPTAFLVEDEVDTIFRAAAPCTLYKLQVGIFIKEIIHYSDFASRTALRINEKLGDRENAIALDYVLGD